MNPFRSRKPEDAPADVPSEEAVFTPEDVSPRAAQEVARSLGELASAIVDAPELQQDVESLKETWEKQAQQPELPPEGSHPAA
jgi:predicted ATP-grasp superfamily ATP-dependent carboligase